MSDTVIRWGVIGTGHITEKVMPAIKGTAGCELYAVASRTQEKAEEFASRWGCTKAYGSYDDFFADSDIDAVYIATLHVSHAELSIRALNAGKHVVCEKPAGVNAEQLRQVLAVAKKAGKFFMEAMWTRFQPAWLRAMELIAGGKIGAVKAISADFCFDGSPRPTERLFTPALAGGALLDVGIYSVMAALDGATAASRMSTVADRMAAVADRMAESVEASFSAVKPATMVSTCRMTPSGVDGFNSISMTFDNGIVATLTSAIDTGCGNYLKSARFVGDKGIIHLPLFWQAQEVNLIGPDGAMAERIALPFAITGYEYEFEEAVRCINAGLCESPRHTWADALHLIETLDDCRRQWGLRYPFEGGDVTWPLRQVQGSLSGSTGGGLLQAAGATRKADPAAAVDVATAAASAAMDGSEEFGFATANPGKLDSHGCESNVVIYTDGACSGNPGRGGWGTVVLADGQEKHLSGGEKLTTNNRMELMAAIEGLEYVLEHAELTGRPVTMICDSQYVKNGIQSWIKSWKKNGWKTASKEPVKNKDLWLELDEAAGKLNIEWRWVKGHAGNKYNEICDQLAVAAAKKQ